MYDPWQVTLTNVQQSMDYYLTGGDAESLRYHLDVLPAPTITSIAVDLDFPDYTKVPDRTNVEGGTVEAIVGTKVTVHARTNMPAQFASLNLKDESLPMEVDSEDPTVLTGRFNVNVSGSYTVNFRTTGGQLNPSPVIYDIIALEDRSPTARFIQPDRPAIKAAANVKIDLVMTGTDDHGVKDATLHVVQGNDNIITPKNMLEGREPQPEFRAVETLDLASYKLKPGSSLQYWLTVRDNKEPTANRFDTARQLIEIGEPLPPAEKKKFEDNQKIKEQPDLPRTDQEQPPDQGQTEPDKVDDPGAGAPPQTPTTDVDKAPPQTDNTPGAADTGSAEESPPNPQGPNSSDAQQKLTSQEEREQEKKLREALGNLQNSTGQQKNGENPSPRNDARGDSGNPASRPPAGNSDRPTNQPDNASRPQQRPALENPAQPNSGVPSTPGNNATSDASNEVERGERGGNQPPPAAGDNRNDKPDATQGQPGRPEQAAPGQPGQNPPAGENGKPGESNSGTRKHSATPPGRARLALSRLRPSRTGQTLLRPRHNRARTHPAIPVPLRARQPATTRQTKVIARRLLAAITSRGLPRMRKTGRLASPKMANRARAIPPSSEIVMPGKTHPRPRMERTGPEALTRHERTRAPVATANPAPERTELPSRRPRTRMERTRPEAPTRHKRTRAPVATVNPAPERKGLPSPRPRIRMERTRPEAPTRSRRTPMPVATVNPAPERKGLPSPRPRIRMERTRPEAPTRHKRTRAPVATVNPAPERKGLPSPRPGTRMERTRPRTLTRPRRTPIPVATANAVPEKTELPSPRLRTRMERTRRDVPTRRRRTRSPVATASPAPQRKGLRRRRAILPSRKP